MMLVAHHIDNFMDELRHTDGVMDVFIIEFRIQYVHGNGTRLVFGEGCPCLFFDQ